MNKNEFINKLKSNLYGFDENEVEKTVAFYSEMIDDLVEDGICEEAAVQSLGSIDEIVAEIKDQMPLTAIIHKKVKEGKQKSKGLWIAITVCGSPVWVPLALAAVIVSLALYISMWAVIAAICAVVFALAVSGIASLIAGILLCFVKSPIIGVCIIGIAISAIGLFFITFMPVFALCKKTVVFTGWLIRKIFGTKKEAV